MTPGRALFLTAMLPSFCPRAQAQATFTGISYADAFLATGSPGNPEGNDLTGLNFGGAGALVVAPAGSAKGEFQSVLKFSLSGATGLFNTTFGSNKQQALDGPILLDSHKSLWYQFSVLLVQKGHRAL